MKTEQLETDEIHDYVRGFPSQGGVEIGPWLERFAGEVPDGSAIVEVGCWLGAGTAHLALGAMKRASPIHVFDRWRATEEEVTKAARFRVALKEGQDTLPIVRELMKPLPANVIYHKGNVREARWNPRTPIGLYVDDATKVETVWARAVQTFFPAFVAGKTILVLMDYHFDEKAGEKYAAQKRYMAKHAKNFKLVAERMAGTTTAVFRYLG